MKNAKPTDQDAPAAAIPAPEADALPIADEHMGKGGMYQLVDGRRVLVERTEDPVKTKLTAAKAD